MRAAQLRDVQRGHCKPQTTDSAHGREPAPNWLGKTPMPSASNHIWVADSTCIWTGEGWLYVAGALDLCRRRIVSPASAGHLETSLPEDALRPAILGRELPAGLRQHSDRGVPYAGAHHYSRMLELHGITPSLSRRAHCSDNAHRESFWGTLQAALIARRRCATRQEAWLAIFDAGETCDNRVRLNSALGYQSPGDYAQHLNEQTTFPAPRCPPNRDSLSLRFGSLFGVEEQAFASSVRASVHHPHAPSALVTDAPDLWPRFPLLSKFVCAISHAHVFLLAVLQENQIRTVGTNPTPSALGRVRSSVKWRDVWAWQDHIFHPSAMHLPRPIACLALAAAFSLARPAVAAEPVLPGVGAAMQDMVAKQEIAGAVTFVVTKEKVLHFESNGMADVASKRAMTKDTLFWIASMTKPITGTAVLMLQAEGRLNVADPVAKYLPEFAALKTPSGKPANLTITQFLTHTSGLGEAGGDGAKNAHTLADLVPLWLAAPMQYEPGAKWKYTQSGINAAARIVEVVSGMTFDAFLQKRLFDPLGMKDTTFYPTDEQRARLATAYAKNKDTGALEAVPPRSDFGTRGRPPQGNGGLYSTAPDYARFCQMLLGGGTFDGHRILSAEAMKFLSTPQTGDLPTGFFQSDTFGQRGKNYGWGIGTSILRAPHEGVVAMLSPGTFGHGGAWGTQAWCDPVRGVAFVLMVQRTNFPNSDASVVRGAFQQAAVDALGKK